MTYDKNYGVQLREVNLTGEAYFDVVKNTGKPFIIHTSQIDIKVLGTAFNVRCYPDEKNTETSLVRGSLEVSLKDRQEKIILKPNEKLVISNNEAGQEKETAAKTVQAIIQPANVIELGHLSLLPQDNSIVETSWVNNKLVFRSETFEELALKMQRWYAVNIIFKDERIKTKRFTGIFENEGIAEALSALKLTTPFSYSIDHEKIIISK
jgi:ferric-dicitrate binding protein FerR (iron transport regulator)